MDRLSAKTALRWATLLGCLLGLGLLLGGGLLRSPGAALPGAAASPALDRAAPALGQEETLRWEGKALPPVAGLLQDDPSTRPPWPQALAADSAVDFSAFPQRPDLAPGAGAGRPTLWVDASAAAGGDGSTPARALGSIQAAIRRAAAGSTIRVRGGLYEHESPEDYRALLIETSDLWILAEPGPPVRLRPAHAEQRYGVMIGASDIYLRGLQLEEFVRSGISLHAPEGRSVERIVVADTSIRFPADDPEGDGIASYTDRRGGGPPASDGLLLQNVTILGPRVLGISCNAGPCRNWRIENSRVVMGAGQEGNSGADALAVEEGDNILVVGLRVERAPGDGVDLKATRAAVYSSVVLDVGRNAIKLWHGGDIVNCLLLGSGADAALVFGRGGRYRVLHSAIYEHHYRGPRAYVMTVGYDAGEEPIDLLVQGSLFYRHSGGIFLSAGTRPRFRHNLFGELGRGAVLDWAGHGAALEGGAELGPAMAKRGLGEDNRWLAEPGFRAPTQRDLRLRADAVAVVDRGEALDALPFLDRSGRPRRLGAAPDLGPDELH